MGVLYTAVVTRAVALALSLAGFGGCPLTLLAGQVPGS